MNEIGEPMEERYFEQFLESIKTQEELEALFRATNEQVTVLLRQAYINGFRTGIEFLKLNNQVIPNDGNTLNF